MYSPDNSATSKAQAPQLLPLSLLNDYLYCARRAALKVVEGWRQANAHTARGDVVHEHADLAGYEVVRGTTLLRALPVWSDRLGLSGKCDIVEQRADGSLYPVEFKVGRRRQWENDDAQLCAQGLCLEEMLGASIRGGAIFHADSKRRREVEFTEELRLKTAQAAAALQALVRPGALPAPEYREACQQCSLLQICLPKITGNPARAVQAARRLFET